jgi:hypothetical protein
MTHTLVLLEDWPELLRVLWREQHPDAHEERALYFAVLGPPAQQTKLLKGGRPSTIATNDHSLLASHG